MPMLHGAMAVQMSRMLAGMDRTGGGELAFSPLLSKRILPMMRASALAAVLLAACATPAVTSPSAPEAASGPGAMFIASPEEEAQILAVTDRFMLAVGNHDHEAMQDMLSADGLAWFQRRNEDGVFGPVRAFPNSSMLEEAADADPFLERYWDPVVLVRGGIAMVWAPYELRDDGAVVHCGIDVLGMVNFGGDWRVGNVMSTMEPGACTELAPPSVGAMRPQDGWRETPNQ